MPPRRVVVDRRGASYLRMGYQGDQSYAPERIFTTRPRRVIVNVGARERGIVGVI